MEKGRESDYSYLWLMVLTIFCWGIVPGFAKLGNLPGDVTTLWVNIVAVLGVAVIIILNGHWRLLYQYQLNDYLAMIGIGLIWPLGYSLAYFFSIYYGSPSLTTVLNYSWPVFYLIFAAWLIGLKVSARSSLFVLFAVSAVACVTFLSGNLNTSNLTAALVLGVLAAITQGLYSTLGDKYQYEPWILTLVVEIVTALGAALFVASRGTFVVPNGSALWYLIMIGIFGNAIGFWSFLAGSQRSHAVGEVAKTTFLMGMCLVPVVAVVLLPLMRAEMIDGWKLLGAIVISAGLIFYRLTLPKEKLAL